MANSSKVGGLLRRIADYLDRAKLPGKSAGSTGEVETIALGLLFTGLIAIATVIHGWFFLPWILIFSVYFTGWTWILFRSAAWPVSARSLLLSFLLLLSIPAGIERAMAMAAFIALVAALSWQMIRPAANVIRREKVSVIAVVLLCFSAYEGFARVVEWRRTAALKVPGGLALDCQARPAGGSTCSALDAVFEVPEFWIPAPGSNLIRDLQNVAALKTYADSATENRIALGVFSFAPEKILQALTQYFSAQKGFLRSKAETGAPLALAGVTRTADLEIYVVGYVSDTQPGYLGEKDESNAMFIFQRQRGTTWLFVIDGREIAGRDFLIHRIISGFR